MDEAMPVSARPLCEPGVVMDFTALHLNSEQSQIGVRHEEIGLPVLFRAQVISAQPRAGIINVKFIAKLAAEPVVNGNLRFATGIAQDFRRELLNGDI